MNIFTGHRRRLAAALLFAACCASAPAAAGETVAGGGRMACDEYLASDEAVKLSIENWVMGFFSFANLRSFHIDLLQNLDNGTLIAAVESFCYLHPSARIADVAVALLKERVASADGHCGSGRLPPTDRLSLCRTPGTDDIDSAGVDMIVPAVE
jgi:hypothetical protein